MSEPFRAEGKWNLVQLVAKLKELPRAFEEVRPQLEQELRAAKAAQELPRLLSARRAALGVTIDEEQLRKLAPAPQPPPQGQKKPAR